MPVALSLLKKQTKELYFYIGEEVPENKVSFVYRPNNITPGFSERVSLAGEAELKSDPFMKIYAEIIESWDLLDEPESEGGKPIPIRKTDGEPNVEALKEIPAAVFTMIMTVIGEDQKPKKEQVTGSLIG